MVELNVSCPNVESGLVMGADPAETARAVEAVRRRCEKPVIVKLTPNATEPAAVAAAAEGAGADAVSLLNTLKGMALDPATRLPWLGGGSGGLSGPAVRAVALEQVAAVSAPGRHPGRRDGRDRHRRRCRRLPGGGRARRGDRHRELPRSRRGCSAIRDGLARLQVQTAAASGLKSLQKRRRGQVARTTLELKSRSR